MRIVLCEAEDPRVLQAAQRAHTEGIARIVLVGDASAHPRGRGWRERSISQAWT